MSEPCATSISAVVADALEFMRPYLAARPYVLFGHSMGAMIAYELAKATQAAGFPPPQALIVSGRLPPDFRYPDRDVHKAEDAVFLAHIRSLGGTAPELFQSRELLQLFLPILRSDYELLSRYRYEPSAASLPTDLIALYSDRDPMIDKPQMEGWQRFATGAFEQHEFSGDHFYLNEAWPQICQIINRKLAAPEELGEELGTGGQLEIKEWKAR